MDEQAFTAYLRRGRRSASARRRCLECARSYLDYLARQRPGAATPAGGPADLAAFLEWLEGQDALAHKPKTYLWALIYLFDFLGQTELVELARATRRARIQRQPFALRGFRGVDVAQVVALEALGIGDVVQLLQAGATPARRQALAAEAGIPEEALLELVKLADLSRIRGVKGIRARLYLEVGLDTLDKLAAADPEALRPRLVAFVERSGFDGVAPWPAELASAVKQARRLPRLVVFDE